MKNYIKQITPEMTQTVNDLKARNFEGATPEEIELYAEWSRIHALQDAEFQQNAQLREQESEQRRQAFEEQANTAMDALNALKDAALAKLKAVENG